MKAGLKRSAHQGKLTIELPNSIVAALGLQEGDEVEADIACAGPQPAPSRQTLAPLRKYCGRMPAGFNFDRHDANSR